VTAPPHKADSGSDASHVASATSDQSYLERYARHIILREVGGGGQKRLGGARVLVVGAGGLGAPMLQYLAACGVGHLGIADDDLVSLSNLQRQVIYRMADIGCLKTAAAKHSIGSLNPDVEVTEHVVQVTAENAGNLVLGYDLVLDGTDNFAARRAVNAACVQNAIPLVSGAISQWEGQVTLIDPANGTPCFDCIFPNEPAPGTAPTCAEGGVIGALPGVVGSLMALEAIKFITRAGNCLRGEMLLFDGLWSESRKIKLARAPDCPVCGNLETVASCGA